MIDFKLNINKGIWHVNFYSEDAKGKRKRKQLSTGIKAYDKYGRKINKRIAEEKAQEIVSRYMALLTASLLHGHWISVLSIVLK